MTPHLAETGCFEFINRMACLLRAESVTLPPVFVIGTIMMKGTYTYLAAMLFCMVYAHAQTTDAQGRKQGYWKKTDEKTNKLVYEGLFKDDKPQGVFKYYYPNDSLRALMTFKQDGKMAYSVLFHSSTGKKMATGKYIGEIKDSVWTYYDESGTLISKDRYVMGKKDGTSYVYYSSGVVSEERNYKMDVQHGPFKQYYDTKALKGEGTYVNGQLEGKNAYYYPNGICAAVGYFKGGTRNGPWIQKDKEGKVTRKELYIYGHEASAKETADFFNKNKKAETELNNQKAGATKDNGAKPGNHKTTPKKS